MPEDRKHVDASFILYDVLKSGFADRATIGCSQFVYWNGRDPRRTVAPDAFVCWDAPDATFKTWKTWERGTPQLAVEIISSTDRSDTSWIDKLEKYRELGVQELVRFDGDAAPGTRVRVWDRIEDDLVERQVLSDMTPCQTLSNKRDTREMLYWVVTQVPEEEEILVLRLARDTAGKDLLPTKAEAAEADAAAERDKARAAQADAAAERDRAFAAEADAAAERDRAEAAEQAARSAQARLAELEALLAAKKT